MSNDAFVITIVRSPSGDWQGIYADTKLVRQGHSIDLKLLLEDLGFVVFTQEVDEDWLASVEELPENLMNIPKPSRKVRTKDD